MKILLDTIDTKVIKKYYDAGILYGVTTNPTLAKRFGMSDDIEMINTIKQKGHTVACYTNSIRKTANLMLDKTGIKNIFDFILTNQDVEHPKPNPEGYLFLMKKFNFDQNDTFIVEDSPKGIEAATKSGANVIKVRNSDEVNIETIRNFI